MKKYILATFCLLFLIYWLTPLSFAAERSLSFGMSGSDVIALQDQLISRGYLAAGRNTGYFGPLTLAAVKKFQCDQNIVCSGASASGYGVYGPRTHAALAASASSGTPSNFEFSGWIPYWRSATGTKDVLPHLTQLKSVMPFVYTVQNDGTLSDEGYLAKEPWTSFIAAAKAAGVRVVPTVMWGNGDAIHQVLSKQTTRIALEDAIADLVKRNNFDGVDIDFEAKRHETIDYFSTFLKGLYQRMGNKWVYCTVEARMPLSERYLPGETIPADAQDYANDYSQMNKYCDRFEIMAYDQGTIARRFNSLRQAPYAPVADPGWVQGLVEMAVQGGVAKNKIILGIPSYGYEYKVTPQTDGSFQYTRLWAFNPKYATDIATRLGLTPTRNSAGEMGLSYDPAKLQTAPTLDELTQSQQQLTATTTIAQNADSIVNFSQPFNYLSWSDSQAIKDKIDLAKKLGLRGVAVFKFDGGEDPKIWDILK